MRWKSIFAVFAAAFVMLSTMTLSTGTANAAVNVYTTPGYHTVNGREWRTTCQAYDSYLNRCQSDIKSGGKWMFNNLTYLPAHRNFWYDNPLARTGKFTSGGREWATSCNDDWTGPNACRNFLKSGNKWVFNSIVHFTPRSVTYPKSSFNQNTGEIKITSTCSTEKSVIGLNNWYKDSSGPAKIRELHNGEQVIDTYRTVGTRSEIIIHGQYGWIDEGNLSSVYCS